MALSFEAQVAGHVARYRERLEAVYKQSAQDVIADAQVPVAKGGRMPVDTGFLRNSLQTSLNGSTSLTGADSYVLTIAGAELGDVIEAGWTANYARAVEYGARGRPPRFFMRGAAQRWETIVQANAARFDK